MSAKRDEIEDAKWVAVNALSVFHHYSSLRLQLTILNVTAMGALMVLFKDSSFENALNEVTVRWGLIFVAFVFTILSFRVSSAAGFHWGLYEKSRNLVIENSSSLGSEINVIRQDYETRMLWRPVTEKRKGKRHSFGFLWGLVNRIPNYIFWPSVNFAAPFLAVLLLL